MHLKVAITTAAVALFSVTAVYAAGNAKEGKAVYDKSCKSCHGANGVAPAMIAKMMKVEIPPLTSPQVQKMSDADMAKVITDGKGKMPAIHTLSKTQVDDVVAYIKGGMKA